MLAFLLQGSMAVLRHSVWSMVREMRMLLQLPLHRRCSSWAAWGTATIEWRWNWDTLAAFGWWTLWKSCWSPAVAAGCKWTEFISVLWLALRTHTPSARHPFCCWTWPTRSPCAGCSYGAPTPQAYRRIYKDKREILDKILELLGILKNSTHVEHKSQSRVTWSWSILFSCCCKKIIF